MELKDSDVVAYDLADGSTFIIRPSGTEPKIKVYILANLEQIRRNVRRRCRSMRFCRYHSSTCTLNHTETASAISNRVALTVFCFLC